MPNNNFAKAESKRIGRNLAVLGAAIALAAVIISVFAMDWRSPLGVFFTPTRVASSDELGDITRSGAPFVTAHAERLMYTELYFTNSADNTPLARYFVTFLHPQLVIVRAGPSFTEHEYIDVILEGKMRLPTAIDAEVRSMFIGDLHATAQSVGFDLTLDEVAADISPYILNLEASRAAEAGVFFALSAILVMGLVIVIGGLVTGRRLSAVSSYQAMSRYLGLSPEESNEKASAELNAENQLERGNVRILPSFIIERGLFSYHVRGREDLIWAYERSESVSLRFIDGHEMVLRYKTDEESKAAYAWLHENHPGAIYGYTPELSDMLELDPEAFIERWREETAGKAEEAEKAEDSESEEEPEVSDKPDAADKSEESVELADEPGAEEEAKPDEAGLS